MNFLNYLDDDELPNPDDEVMLLWESEDDLDFVPYNGTLDA